MKQILTYTFSVVFLTTIILSCDPKKTEPEVAKPEAKEETVKAQTITAADAITNIEFAAWTSAWQANQKTWMAQVNHSINYFGMPLVDLTEVLNQKGIVSSRFYLGLKPLDTLHLVVVGVDAQGNNMLDNAQGQYAYDVSLPCPSACNGGGGPAKAEAEKK